MTKTAQISVLMSVYNAEAFLLNAIESVLAQTYRSFEFIIVNDGSKDASLSLIERYARIDDRIVVISRENRGLIYSLNEAATLAKAPYLARMDADDICHPNRFQKQIDFMQANTDVVALGTWATYINKDGNATGLLGRGPVGKENVDKTYSTGGRFIYHPTLMMRRVAFEAAGGYRAPFKAAEDLDLLVRLYRLGRLDNLAEDLLEYRVHGANISVKEILYQEFMGALIFELAYEFDKTGNDHSAILSSPPTLETISALVPIQDIKSRIIARMINPLFVGDPIAMAGDGFFLAIDEIKRLKNSTNRVEVNKAKALAWIAAKPLIKKLEFGRAYRMLKLLW